MGALLSVGLVSCGANNGSSKDYTSGTNGTHYEVINEDFMKNDYFHSVERIILMFASDYDSINSANINNCIEFLEEAGRENKRSNRYEIDLYNVVNKAIDTYKATFYLGDKVKAWQKLYDSIKEALATASIRIQVYGSINGDGSSGTGSGGGGGDTGGYTSTVGSMCLVTVYYDDGSEEEQIIHVSGECPSGGMGAPNFI